jgi:hypothetical protein
MVVLPSTSKATRSSPGLSMNELNWRFIIIGLTVAPVTGLLVASAFWWKGWMTFGNIVATGVVFAFSLGLILTEHVEIDRLIRECLDAGRPCFPQPSAFTRFAIYAFIGLLEVIAVFSLSLIVEGRRRRRAYAPEWR